MLPEYEEHQVRLHRRNIPEHQKKPVHETVQPGCKSHPAGQY